MNILIVEDEMIVAANLEPVIEELGHGALDVAADYETAVALAEQPVDLGFVDIDLRDGETGPQVGRHLAARGIAVIFVTGNQRRRPRHDRAVHQTA